MCFIPFYSFLSRKKKSPFYSSSSSWLCECMCAVVVFHSMSRSSFLIHFVCKLCELKSVRCVCALDENILMLSTSCTYIMKNERCRVKSSAAAASAVVLKYLLRLPANKKKECVVGELKGNSKLYSTYHNPYIRHLRISLDSMPSRHYIRQPATEKRLPTIVFAVCRRRRRRSHIFICLNLHLFT